MGTSQVAARLWLVSRVLKKIKSDNICQFLVVFMKWLTFACPSSAFFTDVPLCLSSPCQCGLFLPVVSLKCSSRSPGTSVLLRPQFPVLLSPDRTATLEPAALPLALLVLEPRPLATHSLPPVLAPCLPTPAPWKPRAQPSAPPFASIGDEGLLAPHVNVRP